MNTPQLTSDELRILRHALGLDNAKRPYRNGLNIPQGHDERALCEGLETKGNNVLDTPRGTR